MKKMAGRYTAKHQQPVTGDYRYYDREEPLLGCTAEFPSEGHILEGIWKKPF